MVRGIRLPGGPADTGRALGFWRFRRRFSMPLGLRRQDVTNGLNEIGMSYGL